jgi:hypothetical protein
MPITEANPDTATIADTQAAPDCAVCPHPWAGHDRIAARYCTATAAGTQDRLCVCTGHAKSLS